MKKILIPAIILLVVFIVWLVVFTSTENESTVERTYPTDLPNQETERIEVSQEINPMQTVNPVDVQNRYSTYLQNESSANTYTTFSEGGETVPISEWARAMDARINPRLLSLLDEENWRVLRCDDTSSVAGASDVVVHMKIALMTNYPGNLFQDKTDSLANWENTVVLDMANVFYPEEYYPNGSVTRLTDFRTNTEYPYINFRQAAVRLPDGSDGIIGYITIGDEVLVGTGAECLLRAQELVYDTTA